METNLFYNIGKENTIPQITLAKPDKISSVSNLKGYLKEAALQRCS